MRYRFIEVVALWEGRLTSNHLTEFFGFSRDKASKELQQYKQLAPDNLTYDPSLKGYKPTQQFTPLFTSADIEEYRQLVVRQPLNQNPVCFDGVPSVFQAGFEVMTPPLRNIDPVLVQPILKACREKLRLDIGYLSLSNPDYEGRIIAPHTLAYDGLRWHVRAWCEKNSEFRDFVLSRFADSAELMGSAAISAEEDTLWQTWTEVVIEPDPRLSPQQKRIIELDYQMENGTRTIPCRAAMLLYLFKRLGIDHYQNTGEAQQIILQPECYKKIAHYLPGN